MPQKKPKLPPMDEKAFPPQKGKGKKKPAPKSVPAKGKPIPPFMKPNA